MVLPTKNRRASSKPWCNRAMPGEFGRETHPFSLIGEECVTVTPEELWEVVRKTHQKHDA
jgi:hypothetical protein